MPRRSVRTVREAASRPVTSRRRFWLAAAVAALALASPLAIAAIPAAAQQGFDFISVTGDGSGDLAVTASSDYPITDWTLNLTDGAYTYTMDDFTDFTPPSTFETDTPQVYQLPTADAESVFGSSGIALPPGQYTVTATAATDSNGDTLPASQTMSGTFNFLAQPTVTINSADSSSSAPIFYTTAPDQSVTVSGQITGCSTLACPSNWSGTPVTVTNASVTSPPIPSWTGSAATNGDFSVTGVTGIPDDSYSVSVPAVTGSSLVATAPADTQDIPQYAATSITATANPAADGDQSITGLLTYQPPSGFNPVDAPSGVTITATAGKDTVSTTTDANGAFSLALPPLLGTTTWLLSTQNDLATSPFLAGTQSSIGGTQQWPDKITFSASLNPGNNGEVTVAGCLSTTLSQRPPADYPSVVEFQWSKSKSGPWVPFGQLGTESVPGCAGAGFAGTGPNLAATGYEAEYPGGYYRASFAGDATYAAATSARTGRVWIYPTRFQPFRVSPASLAPGGKVKVKGALQYYNGKWRNCADQRATILFARRRNASTWYIPPAGSVKTSSNGSFTRTFTDYGNYAKAANGSQYWSADYSGNATHLAAWAPDRLVRMHGKASTTSSPPAQPMLRVSLEPRLSASTGRDGWPYYLSLDPLLTLMGDE